MKILNLYAGIGGNRKLWGDEHEITAVEYDEKIAAKYQEFFPNDKVVIADAHQYLLDHYGEFDFIWSSPPCPTHSKMSLANHISPYKDNSKQLARGGYIIPRYPDMALYQEIIFLKHFFRGKWCVENVVAYYEPLIMPQSFGGHFFWTNFAMPPFMGEPRKMWGRGTDLTKIAERRGFDRKSLKGLDVEKVIRNCVEPELGKHILDWSQKEWHHTKSFKVCGDAPIPNIRAQMCNKHYFQHYNKTRRKT
jgi:DNA (cytosine-5)-methyltransferase 1